MILRPERRRRGATINTTMPQYKKGVPSQGGVPFNHSKTSTITKSKRININSLPRKFMCSNYEFVKKVNAEYRNAWVAHEQEYRTLFNAWAMYFGAEGEHWDRQEIDQKTERGERVAQYNLIQQYVDTFVGSILSDEYDFKYDPVDGVKTTAIRALEDAYYCDKELFDFPDEYAKVVKDGVIHLGVMEMYINTEYDPRGNIAFRRARPGLHVFDPYWKSDDDDDCTRMWKQGHMSIKQMLEKFKTLPYNDRLQSELYNIMKQGQTFSTPELDEYNQPYPKQKDTYHIIQHYWVEEIKKKRLIGQNKNGDWVDFPITDDQDLLQRFADISGVEDWDNVHETPYKDKICHSAIICPELFPTEFIERGKPEIQIGGLPVIQFTCFRDIAGRNLGKVASMIDPQKDLNYMKSKLSTLTAAQLGGSIVYNKDAFDEESDREAFEKEGNDPTRLFGINGDPRGFMIRTRDHQANPELIRQVQESPDLMEKISGVTAAMTAQAQSSSEPASLFAMKLKQSKIGLVPIDKRVKKLNKRLAEAYFAQAQITYAGPANKNRLFTSRNGKVKAYLNEDLGNGRIRNQVDDIPRCSVVITESPGNLSRQMRDQAELSSLIQNLPQDGFREARAIILKEAFGATSLSDEKKEDLIGAFEREQMKAKLMDLAEMASAAATSKQSELVVMQTSRQIEMMAQSLGQQGEQLPEAISNETPMMEGGGMEEELPETVGPMMPGMEDPQAVAQGMQAQEDVNIGQ